MIKAFENALNADGLLHLQPLDKINKSCCSLPHIVIDFDAVKDTYLKRYNYIGDTPKSCDAIFLDDKNAEFLFLEMKDFQLFKTWNPKKLKASTNDGYDEFFNEVFSNSKILYKINDSVSLFLHISGLFELKKDFFHSLLNRKIKLKFFLVTNYSDRDYLKFSLSTLAQRHSIKNWLSGSLRVVNCSSLDAHLSNL